jgi:hypothetical protein
MDVHRLAFYSRNIAAIGLGDQRLVVFFTAFLLLSF